MWNCFVCSNKKINWKFQCFFSRLSLTDLNTHTPFTMKSREQSSVLLVCLLATEFSSVQFSSQLFVNGIATLCCGVCVFVCFLMRSSQNYPQNLEYKQINTRAQAIEQQRQQSVWKCTNVRVCFLCVRSAPIHYINSQSSKFREINTRFCRIHARVREWEISNRPKEREKNAM